MPVTVTINSVALRRLTGSPGSAGDRYLRRKTEQVASAARVNAVPHGTMTETIQPAYPRPRFSRVTNEHPAALFLENGTRPHVIVPRASRGRKARLRFVPTGGTSPVFARRVNHPGNKAYKILTRALNEVL